MLLRSAALIVKCHHPLAGPRQVGNDEANTGNQFAGVPLDLSHHAPLLAPRACLIIEAGVEAANVVWRPADGTGEKMRDVLLKNHIRFELNGVGVALGFQELIDVRCGESGIAPEVAAQVAFPIAGDNRLQNVAPIMGAVNVAGTQGTPFQIAELVEQEKRMVARATEVTVVGRALLLAMGRADALVHVEDDHLRRATVMHTVDPNAGKFGQCGKVLVAGQVLRLEASHLTGRSGLSFDGLAADNPAHSGIAAKTVGVVHIFITAEASEHRLTKLPRHAVPSVLAGTTVLEKTRGNLGQAKGVVKLPISKAAAVKICSWEKSAAPLIERIEAEVAKRRHKI